MPADLPTKGKLADTCSLVTPYFPRGRIFISCFSEPLGINIEILHSLLLGIQLFIQIHFDRVCSKKESELGACLIRIALQVDKRVTTI